MKSFRDLKVWQKAHHMVLDVYEMTRTFPREERYGLTQQMRRAASSVPTNIVEGFKRRSDKEFAYFLNLADASLEETKYHVMLARDLGYLKEVEHGAVSALCDEVGRMLYGFQKVLSRHA